MQIEFGAILQCYAKLPPKCRTAMCRVKFVLQQQRYFRLPAALSGAISTVSRLGETRVVTEKCCYHVVFKKKGEPPAKGVSLASPNRFHPGSFLMSFDQSDGPADEYSTGI